MLSAESLVQGRCPTRRNGCGRSGRHRDELRCSTDSTSQLTGGEANGQAWGGRIERSLSWPSTAHAPGEVTAQVS